jgi:hypothetical protein
VVDSGLVGKAPRALVAMETCMRMIFQYAKRRINKLLGPWNDKVVMAVPGIFGGGIYR